MQIKEALEKFENVKVVSIEQALKIVNSYKADFPPDLKIAIGTLAIQAALQKGEQNG